MLKKRHFIQCRYGSTVLGVIGLVCQENDENVANFLLCQRDATGRYRVIQPSILPLAASAVSHLERLEGLLHHPVTSPGIRVNRLRTTSSPCPSLTLSSVLAFRLDGAAEGAVTLVNRFDDTFDNYLKLEYPETDCEA